MTASAQAKAKVAVKSWPGFGLHRFRAENLALSVVLATAAAAEPLTVEVYQLPDGGPNVVVNRRADGGVLAVLDVELATVVDRRTGDRSDVAGGVWLDDAKAMGFARELADKRARLKYLEQRELKRRSDPGLLVSAAVFATASYAISRWGPQLIELLARLAFPPPPAPELR